MKKTRLLMLLWLLAGYGSSNIAMAQWGRRIEFQFNQLERNTKIEGSVSVGVHDTAVFDVFNYRNQNARLNIEKPASPILLGVKLNPTLKNSSMPDVRSMSKLFRCYSINDSSEAIVIAMGITKDNVKDYRYRVIEDDSIEVVKWSAIPMLQQNYGAKERYGFIGKFKAINKQLLVEVINVKNYGIREGVIFDWHKVVKPEINQIVMLTPDTRANIVHTYPDDPVDAHPSLFNITATDINRGMATQFDKKTGLPLDMSFNTDSVLYLNIYLKDRAAMSYSIYLVKQINGQADTVNLAYFFHDSFFPVESKVFNKPGKYQLIIQRAGQLGQWPEDQMLRIPFEVKPPPLSEKKVSIKQLIPYTVAALSGVAILFFIYRRQSRARLQKVAQQKEVVGLKLQSIRAQLNPHFMFNALTSIQNLINKNNITGANYYLSKFAVLTRHALDTANDELISLEDELKILDDYLQMEQLRFNFKYELSVDENIDTANTEIPAMLIQPFVENAIKHGIAGLNENGQVGVIISANKTDLLLTVTDNGQGFTSDAKNTGYGIKLSRDRVALLNQIYKDQTVHLDVKSASQGTTVSIRLTNWI